MNQRMILFGLAGAAIAIIAMLAINEANEGPLENAAEDLDSAAEEIADEIEN